MPLRSVALLMLVCLVWAANMIVGRIMLTGFGIPPLWFAGIRFVVVVLLLWPRLTTLPPSFGRVILVSLLMGAAHFGLMFIGLASTPASSAAIIVQLGIPVTTLLSVLFLGETASARRILGMAIALGGALVVIWQPGASGVAMGAVAVLASALALSVGSVMLKTLSGVTPLQLQAWVAACSTPALLLLSWKMESDQIRHSLDAGAAFWLSLAFSAVLVTIWAHTCFFRLLQAHDASIIAPLTLAMPVMAVAMGVIITGDVLTLRFMIGAMLVLLGIVVLLVGPASGKPGPGSAT